MVIVADNHELDRLIAALLQAGVKATEIYVSKDAATPELIKSGVKCDLYPGRLHLTKPGDGTRDLRNSNGTDARDIDWIKRDLSLDIP